MATSRSRVFFAIPCGGFYDLQQEAIRRVARAVGVEPVVAEDDVRTKELWRKITADIDRCDLFVADIGSDSKNIALELGYALARKPADRIGILIANAAGDPSDLRGYLLQKYGSLNEFESRLGSWLSEATGLPVPSATHMPPTRRVAYREEFRDLDRFLRLWSVPPGAAFHLVGDGLKVGDAHWPVLTKQLGLVRDCDVEFRARIDRQQIGWTVMGTQKPQDVLPTFCVMFALRSDGTLVPHMWSAAIPGSIGGYHRYDAASKRIRLKIDRHRWFTMVTRVRGHRIQLIHRDRVVFDADMSLAPFREVYRSVPQKQGNIGFRCFPGEEPTIASVVVREPAVTRRSRRRHVAGLGAGERRVHAFTAEAQCGQGCTCRILRTPILASPPSLVRLTSVSSGSSATGCRLRTAIVPRSYDNHGVTTTSV